MRTRALIASLVLAAVALTAGLGLGRPGPAHSAGLHKGETGPPIRDDRLDYGAKRKREMAGYSKRHYGEHTWRLRDPKLIVLHFTGGATYGPAYNEFASDAPNLGELPGTCAHYIVDKEGTIHEIVPIRIRCRHAIGLNHVAIGIEMIQEQGSGSHWADEQILHRGPQIHAVLRLVNWLQRRRGIPTRDVIGHRMANENRYFEDREGWRNDHTDWGYRDVKVVRDRLHRLAARRGG